MSTKRKKLARRAACYLLPDGTRTAEVKTYAAAWRALGTPIEERMGVRLFGFDPSLSFARERGGTLRVDVDLAMAFRTMHERLRLAERIIDALRRDKDFADALDAWRGGAK